MSKIPEETKRLVSANIRKAMALQEVTPAHLMQVLNMSQSGVNFKLSNREGNHFSSEQILTLSQFFAIPVDELISPVMSEEVVIAGKHKAPKFNKSGEDDFIGADNEKRVTKDIPIPPDEPKRKAAAQIPPIQHQEEETEDIIQDLIDHIDLGGEASEAYELKLLIYQRTLTGRIPNIAPFLGNSLLATALRTYRKKRKISAPIDITEEQQTRFVSYYTEQYEDWKKSLWPDDDKEIALVLVNNKLNSVTNLVKAAVQMPDASAYTLVDQCPANSPDRVDVKLLSGLLNIMIEDLMHLKKPLDDYLYEQLNVSGS